jgi:hypothetical protein
MEHTPLRQSAVNQHNQSKRNIIEEINHTV